MVRHTLFRLAISLACLTIASCAAIKEQITTEPAGWTAEQQKRQQIKAWEIRGRLGVQTEDNGGVLDIIWKHSEQEFSIRLIAPLGAGSYLVQGSKESAEIRFPDGEKTIINNIDDVFKSILKVDLPASAVNDWVRGLPAKKLTIESISWNEQGLLEKVKQAGWNVELKKYTGTKILLPHTLYLSRDDNIDLSIKLVLKRWLIDSNLAAGK